MQLPDSISERWQKMKGEHPDQDWDARKDFPQKRNAVEKNGEPVAVISAEEYGLPFTVGVTYEHGGEYHFLAQHPLHHSNDFLHLTREEARVLEDYAVFKMEDSYEELSRTQKIGYWLKKKLRAYKSVSEFSSNVKVTQYQRAEPEEMNKVYEERNKSVLGMLKALHENGVDVGYREVDIETDQEVSENESSWAIVWAELPDEGEVSWHIPRNMLPDWIEEGDGNYDEYDTETKYRRLKNFYEEV